MTPIEIPGLATKVLGRSAFHLTTTRSTQDDLKSLLPSAAEGTLVLADHQAEGRGRQRHTWISLPGRQLIFSLLLRPNVPISSWPIFNIVAGLALAEAIERQGRANVQIKWPNDVFLNERKVAGILSEASAPALLLGVGVNVSGRRAIFPEEIRSTATSLEEEMGVAEPFQLLSEILLQLEEWNEVVSEGEFSTVATAFSQRWIYKNLPIRITSGEEKLEGVAQTIDTDGALMLETSNGQHRRILSGDVSLRTVAQTPEN